MDIDYSKLEQVINKIKLNREKKKISRIYDNNPNCTYFERVEDVGNILSDQLAYAFEQKNITNSKKKVLFREEYSDEEKNYENYDSFENKKYTLEPNQLNNFYDLNICNNATYKHNTYEQKYKNIILADFIDSSIYNQINKMKINEIKNETRSEPMVKKKQFKIINETYQDYIKKMLIRDNIKSKREGDKWIYDILNGVSEIDNTIHSDKFFKLIFNQDWNGYDLSEKNLKSLHLLALPMDKTLRCIRSLTANDLPLLNYIKETSLTIIDELYGLKRNMIKIYFHYLPSVYHLHIHFININGENLIENDNFTSYDLDTVIFNLGIKSDYYQTVELKIKTNI